MTKQELIHYIIARRDYLVEKVKNSTVSKKIKGAVLTEKEKKIIDLHDEQLETIAEMIYLFFPIEEDLKK